MTGSDREFLSSASGAGAVRPVQSLGVRTAGDSTRAGQERRTARRYAVALTVEGARLRAVTRNMSATGVLFEAADADGFEAGTPVRFCVGLRTVAGRLCCHGHVVRVERSGSGSAVATTIDRWELECHGDTGAIK